jgi:hypothetical protein
VETIQLVFVGSFGNELDRVTVNVRDSEDCAHEVKMAITRAQWMIGVGDRIEIRAP